MTYAECSGLQVTGKVSVKPLVPEETFAYLQEMLSVRLLEMTDECAESSNNRAAPFTNC
jgi:hypothetical protein